MENASSEQELLELRSDGKISADEYKQLLDAMKTSPASEIEKTELTKDKGNSKRKLSSISFCLILSGLVLLALLYSGILRFLSLNKMVHISWFTLEIAALIIALIAWKDIFAKAAVFMFTILFIFVLLAILL